MNRPAQNRHRAWIGLSANALSLTIRATGVLALVLLVTVAPAAASSRHAATEASPPKIIRLISSRRIVRVLMADKPPQGNSTGNQVYTTNVLTKKAVAQFGVRKGAVVGSDAGRTTNIGGIPMTVNILVALPGGAPPGP